MVAIWCVHSSGIWEPAVWQAGWLAYGKYVPRSKCTLHIANPGRVPRCMPAYRLSGAVSPCSPAGDEVRSDSGHPDWDQEMAMDSPSPHAAPAFTVTRRLSDLPDVRALADALEPAEVTALKVGGG